jgi:LPS sulfotransferase NodH
MRNFVVVTQQRSGSSFLRHLLNAHPGLHCNPEHPTTDVRRCGAAWAYQQGFALPRDRTPEAVGFVMKLHQDLHHAFPSRPDLKILLLHRQNRLATLLSYRVSQLLGPSEAPEHGILTLDDAVARRRALPPLTIPISEAERFFEAWTARTEEVLRCMEGIAWIEVVYETLCRDAEAAMQPVYSYLGVAPPSAWRIPETAGRKLDPRPLAEAIANYTELKAYFLSTRWASFFEA